MAHHAPNKSTHDVHHNKTQEVIASVASHQQRLGSHPFSSSQLAMNAASQCPSWETRTVFFHHTVKKRHVERSIFFRAQLSRCSTVVTWAHSVIFRTRRCCASRFRMRLRSVEALFVTHSNRCAMHVIEITKNSNSRSREPTRTREHQTEVATD